MKQFITPSGIINVAEVANATEQAIIGKKFHPKRNPNDSVRLAISKRTMQNKKVTKIYHSLADLKELIRA